MSQREKIGQFKSFTEERSDSVATKFLKAAKWNVEQAVNAYFDSPPEEPSRASKSSSSGRASAFNQEAANEWFDRYRDITLSGEKFSVDGIQQLAADIGIDPNDPVLFVFAWKCNCQQICEFTKAEFITGLSDPQIRADSPEKFKGKIEWLRNELKDREKFREYYIWLFSYAKDNHARHMDQATAISVWPMVLEGRFIYISQWTAFLEESHNKPISKDAWTQLLAFVNLVSDNPSLDKYDPADSWPVVIDSFVDWLRKNGHVPNPAQ